MKGHRVPWGTTRGPQKDTREDEGPQESRRGYGRLWGSRFFFYRQSVKINTIEGCEKLLTIMFDGQIRHLDRYILSGHHHSWLLFLFLVFFSYLPPLVLLGASKRLYKRLWCPMVCCLVGWSVGPHITLNLIFSAVCRWIDLKFGGDLHVNLLFQFFLFFFLNSSSNSSFSAFSSFSSEMKSICNLRANCLFGKVESRRKWTSWTLNVLRGPAPQVGLTCKGLNF
jgi:hypothetical protein